MAVHVLIGIVGYCAFVERYPLGPALMRGLRAVAWPGSAEVEITELNWGPVAIVQDLQARAVLPQRVVLIGAPDRGLAPGTVTCRRWVGAGMEPALVQQRMFEAVTGVIGLDNLLVIGAHFRVWPQATYTVELQWPATGLGDLVLDEAGAGPGTIVGERPLSPGDRQRVGQLVAMARALAIDDPPPAMQALSREQLTAVAPVLHHRFLDDLGLPP